MGCTPASTVGFAPHGLVDASQDAKPTIIPGLGWTKLTRPPNEIADVLGDFERRLARLLLVSFKDSGKLQ